MVDKMDNDQWGNKITGEQKKEFSDQLDSFSKELRQALDSLNQNVTLKQYPQSFKSQVKDCLQKNVPPRKEMTDEFFELFKDWNTEISQAIEDLEKVSNTQEDQHPQQELEHWKQKMRRLTGIAEQLKSKNCNDVLYILTMASNSNTDIQGKSKDNMLLQISKWRNLDLRVTQLLNEAKDNVKYLQTLEKFIDPLYNGDPETIQEVLPALMNSIKMIHTIARYYNTNERMTQLFVKITNQMIIRCKFTILNFKEMREKAKNGTKFTENNDMNSLWKFEDFPPD
jgi:dynein heavy chain